MTPCSQASWMKWHGMGPIACQGRGSREACGFSSQGISRPLRSFLLPQDSQWLFPAEPYPRSLNLSSLFYSNLTTPSPTQLVYLSSSWRGLGCGWHFWVCCWSLIVHFYFLKDLLETMFQCPFPPPLLASRIKLTWGDLGYKGSLYSLNHNMHMNSTYF